MVFSRTQLPSVRATRGHRKHPVWALLRALLWVLHQASLTRQQEGRQRGYVPGHDAGTNVPLPHSTDTWC